MEEEAEVAGDLLGKISTQPLPLLAYPKVAVVVVEVLLWTPLVVEAEAVEHWWKSKELQATVAVVVVSERSLTTEPFQRLEAEVEQSLTSEPSQILVVAVEH